MFIVGILLALIALFVLQHEHFSSAAVFHPQEPRFGIQAIGVNFADDATTVDLKVIDRDTSDYTKEFSKFYPPFDSGKALLYVNGDRKWPIHLRQISPPLEEFQKRHTSAVSNEDTIALVFEGVAHPEQQTFLELQFLDFPNLEIHTHNAELVKIPILRSIPSNVIFVFAFILLGSAIFGIVGENRASRAPAPAPAALPKKREEPKPQKSEDELKMENALLRAKRDAQFAAVLRMAKKLHTIEATQEWQKEERLKVSNDGNLTEDEKEERWEQIDRAAADEKQRLKDSASIYEED